MDKKLFKDPDNSLRIYRLLHSIPDEYEKYIDENIIKMGFGGVVINADWHTGKDDTRKYLCEQKDFENLDERIKLLKSKGLGIWLYDEKGYPSASADGLTLENHPEYEARGFTVIETGGEDFEIGDKFEKIIYACKNDGTPVEFTEHKAKGADLCYAVRPVFEGSHAQCCGWGPRRYPNLLDKDAIASFISCTYDKYYDNTKGFDQFEAVFTDEPSLMSGYVNYKTELEYAFLPWQEDLPNKFKEIHGVDFYSVITELFDKSDVFNKNKLMFWETVAEMINEAYFVQIRDWCRNHNIVFSGHCLLEEFITMHTPLYGNLVKCLKSFDYPGVDMLTGSADAFRKDKENQYALSAKYVGSVARMTGKTQRVMVEICPLIGRNGNVEFTFEQEVGTMDLTFMCGINHINSYLAPERLNGRFKEYADYFARAAYILRDSTWCGEIGVYYPIETMQGHYYPNTNAMNMGAEYTPTEKLVEDTLFDLYNNISEANLDFTFVDSEWINEAEIADGKIKMNGLEISVLVMPAVKYLYESISDKLKLFEKNGGKVIWIGGKPESEDVEICNDVITELKNSVDYGISIKATDLTNVFVSPLIRDGKRVWYVINSSNTVNEINISVDNNKSFEVWHNMNGEVTDKNSFVLAPYTSVFVREK